MAQELDEILSASSGSVGTLVYARNPHGPYVRARTTPIDPNTVRQQRVRNRMAAVSPMWATVLTPAQRQSWYDYAGRVTLPDRLGVDRHLSGQQLFVRNNAGRTRPFMGVVLTAPTAATHGHRPNPSATDIIAAGFVHVAFDTADEWVTDDGAYLIVYASDGWPTTYNFFAGPWRFVGAVAGSSTTPPTSPQGLVDPWFPGTAGKRWAKTRVAYGDGRLTSPVLTVFTGL